MTVLIEAVFPVGVTNELLRSPTTGVDAGLPHSGTTVRSEWSDASGALVRAAVAWRHRYVRGFPHGPAG
jgi:hypothetical protein